MVMKYVVSIVCIVILIVSPTVFSRGRSFSKIAKIGLYSFPSKTHSWSSLKKPYIGKSIDMDRRVKEHIGSGKLERSDLGKVTMTPRNLRDKDLKSVEKETIRTEDILTKGELVNKHHAPWSRGNQKIRTLTHAQLQKFRESIK
jgi:hypothetical protein